MRKVGESWDPDKLLEIMGIDGEVFTGPTGVVIITNDTVYHVHNDDDPLVEALDAQPSDWAADFLPFREVLAR